MTRCSALFRMKVITTLLALAILLCSVATARADDTPQAEPPVATVNGKVITRAGVDAYSDMYQTPYDFALRDLIDLLLLKAAAAEQQVALPAEPWSSEIHDGIELIVARRIGIEEAKPRIDLVLDHAWIKDSENAAETAAGREALEKMRVLAVEGITIPEAFARLQLDGSLWHIGDHEVYPYESIPPEARDLAPGAISGVTPGDGGLHLFRIYERKENTVSMDVISSHLREELRRRAIIEQFD